MKIQKTQKHCPIPSGNIVAAGAAVVSNSPGQVSRVIGRRLAGQRSIPEELPGTTGALCTIPLCIRVAPPILRAAGYVTQPWCHTGHQLVLIEGKGLLFPCILLIIFAEPMGKCCRDGTHRLTMLATGHGSTRAAGIIDEDPANPFILCRTPKRRPPRFGPGRCPGVLPAGLPHSSSQRPRCPGSPMHRQVVHLY